MMFILLLARDNIYTDKRNQSLAQRQMVFLRQKETRVASLYTLALFLIGQLG